MPTEGASVTGGRDQQRVLRAMTLDAQGRDFQAKREFAEDASYLVFLQKGETVVVLLAAVQ